MGRGEKRTWASTEVQSRRVGIKERQENSIDGGKKKRRRKGPGEYRFREGKKQHENGCLKEAVLKTVGGWGSMPSRGSKGIVNANPEE